MKNNNKNLIISRLMWVMILKPVMPVLIPVSANKSELWSILNSYINCSLVMATKTDGSQYIEIGIIFGSSASKPENPVSKLNRLTMLKFLTTRHQLVEISTLTSSSLFRISMWAGQNSVITWFWSRARYKETFIWVKSLNLRQEIAGENWTYIK